jgi:hypothetical protein
VKGLVVLEPQQWEWSSPRHYVLAEPGIVLIEDKQKAEMKVRQIA